MNCKRCDRPLKSKASLLTGYGKACYRKQRQEDKEAGIAPGQLDIYDILKEDESDAGDMLR